MSSLRLLCLIAFFSVAVLGAERHSDDAESGIGFLNSEAARLRDQSRAEHAKEWAPIDNMLNTLGSTKKQQAKAQTKEDNELQQSPKQLGFPTYDENGMPDLNLLQDDGSWSPEGQVDLADAVKAAHDNEEEEKLKSDGLSGDHLLSSAGLEEDSSSEDDPTNDDFGDLGLVQVQDSDSEWVPMGQEGIKQKLDMVRSDEHKRKLKEDGLKGDHLLSSVGMDRDPLDDIQFVQESADSEWVPTGQPGMSDVIDHAKEEEQKKKRSEDGLKGDHLLSSVGLEGDSDAHEDADVADETFFVQRWTPKPLLKSNADDDHKMTVHSSASAADQDGLEDEDESEEIEKLSDASMGSDILEAGNLGHLKMKDDDYDKIGTLTTEDIHF